MANRANVVLRWSFHLLLFSFPKNLSLSDPRFQRSVISKPSIKQEQIFLLCLPPLSLSVELETKSLDTFQSVKGFLQGKNFGFGAPNSEKLLSHIPFLLFTWGNRNFVLRSRPFDLLIHLIEQFRSNLKYAVTSEKMNWKLSRGWSAEIPGIWAWFLFACLYGHECRSLLECRPRLLS